MDLIDLRRGQAPVRVKGLKLSSEERDEHSTGICGSIIPVFEADGIYPAAAIDLVINISVYGIVAAATFKLIGTDAAEDLIAASAPIYDKAAAGVTEIVSLRSGDIRYGHNTAIHGDCVV